MKIIKSNKSGELLRSEKAYFGGAYSFLEKLKLKGIGSPKVIYHDGSDRFDLLKRDIEGEIIFVNFEIMKNGLLLRANCNQRRMILGIRLDELRSINLVGYRIKIKAKKLGGAITKIVHKGELTILSSNENDKTCFTILTRSYDDLVAFFNSDSLNRFFHHSVSLNEPQDHTNAWMYLSLAELFD